MPRPADKSSPEYAQYKAEKRARKAAREAAGGGGDGHRRTRHERYSSAGAIVNLDESSNDRGRQRAYEHELSVTTTHSVPRSRSRHGSPSRSRSRSRSCSCSSASDSGASHRSRRSTAHGTRQRAVSFRDEHGNGGSLAVPGAVAHPGSRSHSRSRSTSGILTTSRERSSSFTSPEQQQRLYPHASATEDGGRGHSRSRSTSNVSVSGTIRTEHDLRYAATPQQQKIYPQASASASGGDALAVPSASSYSGRRSRSSSNVSDSAREQYGAGYQPSGGYKDPDPYGGDYGPQPYSAGGRPPLPPPSPGPYAQSSIPPPASASSFSHAPPGPGSYGPATYPPPGSPGYMPIPSPGMYGGHSGQPDPNIPTIPGIPSTVLPGEGTGGKVYPPGQTPYQHPNPDYYSDVLSSSQTTSSLSHSLTQTSSGLPGVSPVASPHELDQNGKPASSSSSSLLIPGLVKLAVDALSPNSAHGSKPPAPGASPAMQPYHGTYQSISPLPSPGGSPLFSASGSVTLAGKTHSFSLGEPAYPQSGGGGAQPPLSPSAEKHRSRSRARSRSSSPSGYSSADSRTHSRSHSRPRHRTRRHASRSRSRERRPYDPAADAQALLSALKSSLRHAPSPRPLVTILPTLTPSQLLALRSEYKAAYMGVNLSKHIKSEFPPQRSLFGKLAFAVALGPAASEAWFANSWYQKGAVRNELLIEALMGKSPSEIAAIRKAFKDAKYGPRGLEAAVEHELPDNKFRRAVLRQLSFHSEEDEERERRVDVESSAARERIRDDVARLGAVLERAEPGTGETELVAVLVGRSERWIGEVAELYRQAYGRGLDRAVMKHSRNLVGEALLHIITAAIDRPLRDAKLLNAALDSLLPSPSPSSPSYPGAYPTPPSSSSSSITSPTTSSSSSALVTREDLLVSRATRIHWDPSHMKRVKRVFRKKYHVALGVRINEVRAAWEKELGRGDGLAEAFWEMLLRMVREWE